MPVKINAKFKPDPQAEERKRSAFTLIKLLLAADVLPKHRRDLLNIALWKLTEAEGGSKYNTRFRSQHALNCTDKAKLRHDHVFRRAKMITDLMEITPDKIDDILERAVGCVVTAEEHDRLKPFDKKYDGWERYQKAKISAIDTLTGKRVV